MTSEGQHAGQPAEATSGGGAAGPTAAGSAFAAPRAADGFPTGADAHPPTSSPAPQNGSSTAQPSPAAPQTGWGRDAYPNSYGPPPYPASGSGSPFVVPAVPVFGAPNGEPQPSGPAAAGRVGGSDAGSAVPPEAWAPQGPAESAQRAPDSFHRPAEPHPYRPQPSGEQPVSPFGAQRPPQPYLNGADGHPYRGSAVSASASVPIPPLRPDSMTGSAPHQPPAPNDVAPSSPAGRAAVGPPSLRQPSSDQPSGADAESARGGPLPSRADRPPFGGPDGPGNPDAMSGFNGFVSPSAARQPGASTGDVSPSSDARQPDARQPEANQPEANQPEARPAGISAFGGQRVRVPGAALNELPDVPPQMQAGHPSDSGGFHLRGAEDLAPGASAPRQTNNGLPVRGSGTQPSFPAPVGGGFAPVRTQEPPGDHPGHDPGAFASRAQAPDPFAAHRDQSARDRGPEPAAVSVPQPRSPIDAHPGRPAVPTAAESRPVSASASVPVASRVAPPSAVQEAPPLGANPRPRVYGRATPPEVATTPPDALPTPAGDPPFRPGPDAFGPMPVGDPAPGERRTGTREDADDRVGTGTLPDAGTERGGQDHAGSTAQPHPQQRSGDGPGEAGPDSASVNGFGRPAYGPRSPESGPPTGRASASARVAPPDDARVVTPAMDAPTTPPPAVGEQFPPAAVPPFGPRPADRPAMPFTEHTVDVSGRGRAPERSERAGAPVAFSEHTSDLAGRGTSADRPYVPAPALPTMHASPPGVDGFPPPMPVDPQSGRRPGRQQLSGMFPAPANRATVTPPGPLDGADAPAVEDKTEQSRFEAFKPDAVDPAPEKPEAAPHVRMLPVLLGVILASALLVGMAIGVVWLISRPGDNGLTVNPGDCVKRNGDSAVTTSCGEPNSFQVVSKVDTREQCGDPGQPYVDNPAGNGRTQVLCLKPSS